MDTKHINDKLDPTAIAAKALTLEMRTQEDAGGEAGSEDAAADDAPKAEPAARPQRARVEYVIHRLAGRTVPRRGGRR